MKTYRKIIFIGDHAVSVRVQDAETYAERVKNEAAEVKRQFDRVLATYGMRCEKIS